MNKKNLIVCSVCEGQGKKEILGELTPEGFFSVLRFHQGSTVFESQEFTVRCRCGAIVYQKIAQASLSMVGSGTAVAS